MTCRILPRTASATWERRAMLLLGTAWFLLVGNAGRCAAQAPSKGSENTVRLRVGLGLELDDSHPAGVVKIKSVEAAGTAAKLGLRVGDILFSVAGQPMKSRDD